MQESINNQSMLKVGTILHGTYRIDSYLSSGGFGNTYVATNIEFDERVAIKEFFMKGVTQRDDNQTTVSVSNTENHNSFLEQKEKFKKEARRIRQLKNEHIVSVHDLFEENGTAYYVMDYVDGENLAERLKRTGRPMTESEVRLILPQILDALKSVHDEGMWHLDLKPANIMVDKAGNVKLIDFGASKQLNAQKGGATTSTAITYTNGYAPREQMEQNYDKFGPWTDIYALGATLYTLLTNKKPPLPTDIDDHISEDKHEALPFPDDVSEGMKSMVLTMINTNRLKRPKNIDIIIGAEKAYTEEKGIKERVLQPKAPFSSLPINDNEETIIIAKPVTHEEQTYEIADTSSTKNQESNSNKTIVNYLVYPFKHYWVSLLALLNIVCVLGHQIPGLFYSFGEYNNVLETYTLGSFQLDTFIPFVIFVQYLFYIVNICITIPFIIGVWPFSKVMSNLMILSQILEISKLIENLIVPEPTILNWILFYAHLLIYCVCGILMVFNYKGNIVVLGTIFIGYSFLCIALNIPYNLDLGITFDTNLQYFIYESFVWGIDIIWACGMWWMLTRKENVYESC